MFFSYLTAQIVYNFPVLACVLWTERAHGRQPVTSLFMPPLQRTSIVLVLKKNKVPKYACRSIACVVLAHVKCKSKYDTRIRPSRTTRARDSNKRTRIKVI